MDSKQHGEAVNFFLSLKEKQAAPKPPTGAKSTAARARERARRQTAPYLPPKNPGLSREVASTPAPKQYRRLKYASALPHMKEKQAKSAAAFLMKSLSRNMKGASRGLFAAKETKGEMFRRWGKNLGRMKHGKRMKRSPIAEARRKSRKGMRGFEAGTAAKNFLSTPMGAAAAANALRKGAGKAMGGSGLSNEMALKLAGGSALAGFAASKLSG